MWDEYGTPERYDLTARVDYQRKLTRQLPPATHRVVYTASGARLAAARLTDSPAVVQHKLYWAAANSVDEAHYLTAILNSATLAVRVAPYQSRGQSARDFDLYVWYIAIPRVQPRDRSAPSPREARRARRAGRRGRRTCQTGWDFRRLGGGCAKPSTPTG